MSKIIISYRRLDSQDIAMRIRDVMTMHFGERSVFTDIDSIPYGVDFLDHINSELSTCDALIAIVGPRWIDAGQGPGQGVHLETDFVRVEVEAALKRKIPVIPALVAGTRMPKPDELPDALRPFAFRNGTSIDSGVNFRNDVNRLIRSLDETLAPNKIQEKREKSKKTQEKSQVASALTEGKGEPTAAIRNLARDPGDATPTLLSAQAASSVTFGVPRLFIVGVVILVVGAIALFATLNNKPHRDDVATSPIKQEQQPSAKDRSSTERATAIVSPSAPPNDGPRFWLFLGTYENNQWQSQSKYLNFPDNFDPAKFNPQTDPNKGVYRVINGPRSVRYGVFSSSENDAWPPDTVQLNSGQNVTLLSTARFFGKNEWWGTIANPNASGWQTIKGTRVYTEVDQAAGIATFSNNCGTQRLTQRQLQAGAIPDQIIPCPRPQQRSQ